MKTYYADTVKIIFDLMQQSKDLSESPSLTDLVALQTAPGMRSCKSKEP